MIQVTTNLAESEIRKLQLLGAMFDRINQGSVDMQLLAQYSRLRAEVDGFATPSLLLAVQDNRLLRREVAHG